jgi:peroxiredoxin
LELGPSAGSRRVAWLTAAGGLLLGLGIGLALFATPLPSSSAADAATQEPVVAPIVDSLAPDFELETVDGDLVRLSDLRGEVVALNFWATWCAPCRLEMPDLQARADAYGDRLTVLGVNFDETAEEVDAFRQDVGVRFPLLLDPGGEVQRLYRVLGYPTTFFIDSEGVIRIQHLGLMSAEQIDQYLEELGLTS